MKLIEFTDTIGLSIELVHIPSAYAMWIARLSKPNAEVFLSQNETETMSKEIYGSGMTPDEAIAELCAKMNQHKVLIVLHAEKKASQYRLSFPLEY